MCYEEDSLFPVSMAAGSVSFFMTLFTWHRCMPQGDNSYSPKKGHMALNPTQMSKFAKYIVNTEIEIGSQLVRNRIGFGVCFCFCPLTQALSRWPNGGRFRTPLPVDTKPFLFLSVSSFSFNLASLILSRPFLNPLVIDRFFIH